MKRPITRALAVLAIILAGFGALLTGFAGTAGAAGNPPWEPVGGPDVGSLVFYNSAGQQITGGDLTDNPIAAYVQGTTTLRAGDNKATLKVYTPVNGQAVGAWGGNLISGSASTFPNSGAPGSLGTSTLPLYTGNSSLDNSLGSAISSLLNTDTSNDGYAGIYVLRLVTSASGLSATTSYDAVDISVTGSTWSVVYPTISSPPTTTTLAETPASPQVFGTSVTLSATVSPSTAPGTVQFEQGSTPIGVPVPVTGGTASISTTTLPVGTDALSAVFTPTAPAPFVVGYGASTGTSSFIVNLGVNSTSTALGVNPNPSAADTPVTLTGTVTSPASGGTALAAGTGSVSFYDNGATNSTGTVSTSSTLLGSAAVGAGGTATLSYTFTGVGTHNLVAQFTGATTSTATFNVSTSPNVSYVANTPPTNPNPTSSETDNIDAVIPGGGITISTPYWSGNVFHLGTATINSGGTEFVATNAFGSATTGSGVTITDTRADDQSWTATALVSAFIGNQTPTAAKINAQNLSFTGIDESFVSGNNLQVGDVTPTQVTSAGGYAAGASGSDGLGGLNAHTFASALAGTPSTLTSVDGSVNVYGNLTLTAPTSTPAGTYTATLTFTVG